MERRLDLKHPNSHKGMGNAFVPSLILLAVALAPDVSGRWSGTVEIKTETGATQSVPVFLILKHEGERLSGSGGLNETQQSPIRNGQVSGEKLTCEIEADNFVFRLELKLEGDRITVKCAGAARRLRAERPAHGDTRPG